MFIRLGPLFPNFALRRTATLGEGAVVADVVLSESSYRVYEEIRERLACARQRALASVNYEMVLSYWEVGRRITEEQGDRAAYGKKLISFLAEKLTAEFGDAFSERNLRYMKQFYCVFPIVNALRSQLSWTRKKPCRERERTTLSKTPTFSIFSTFLKTIRLLESPQSLKD